MRPFGPLRLRVCKSIPACLARRLASGVATTRDPTGVSPRMVSAETFDTVGRAGSVAALASQPALIQVASTSPTGTVAPARTRISPMQPSADASISLATFSVSITKKNFARSHALTRFDPPFRQGALSHGQAELRHEEIVLHAHRAYWPVNCGLRFSKNAEQPS